MIIHREEWIWPDVGEPYTVALCTDEPSNESMARQVTKVTCPKCLGMRIPTSYGGRWPERCSECHQIGHHKLDCSQGPRRNTLKL
jgi:hypothetical protein